VVEIGGTEVRDGHRLQWRLGLSASYSRGGGCADLKICWSLGCGSDFCYLRL
jgi:hypothetical protein